MTTILGAVLSLAVIAGAVMLIREIRRVCRYLEVDRRLAQMSLRPADPPAGRRPVSPRLAVVTCLRRRWRPYRAATVAGAGLLGSLGTAAAFVICFNPSAPVADQPPAVRTLTNTVTSELHPDAVITMPPDATVTVVTTSSPAAVASPQTVTRQAAAPAPSHPAAVVRGEPPVRSSTTPTLPASVDVETSSGTPQPSVSVAMTESQKGGKRGR